MNGTNNEETQSSKYEHNYRFVKDSKTGRLVIVGPPFTKEDIDRDFPKGSGRDARIMRKSVRLPTK